MVIKYLILFTILLLTMRVSSQETVVAKFVIKASLFKQGRFPVSGSLYGVDFNSDKGKFRLYEVNGKGRSEIPCQLEPGIAPRLWWIAEKSDRAIESRSFILIQDTTHVVKNEITTVLSEKALVVKKNGQKVLQYNVAEVFPPDSVNPIFKRSGFIHPVWSPCGNILTRINPPDHHHHMGIWNPWTRTLFEGHNTDYWNLGEGQGTVRFAGINSMISGPVFGGFKVRQEHVDFQCKGGDKVTMDEVWDVRIWNIGSYDGVKVCVWDLTTTLSCATSSPITLEAYRYGGGIGFRANEGWTNKNSWVLTSEGKGRKDADGSRARWCNVGGEFSDFETSGILFMSNPSNREFPEPMRVWPEDSNGGRGDLFFEFCPIRNKGWELIPGNEYVLKYRMLVFDGKIDANLAERVWSDFANPVAATAER